MTKKPKANIIFIVEDNAAYGKLLGEFFKNKFPDISAIKIFPSGESCLMELYQNPVVVVMDHLLNSIQSDAATGLSTIKKIKTASPDTNVILLSAQTEFDVVSKSIIKYGCTYVQKDEQAFSKVEELVKGFLKS